MTKEKPLSEKEWDMSIYPNDEEAHMFLRKDVALAVKRLKNSFIDLNLTYEQRQLLIKNIDEIFGEFK